MTRAERQVRRALLAQPWRVRAERGAEIVATALDGLAPGATAMGWRDQLDLVRGGLRTRRQRRPPWPHVLWYRLGGRLHPRWLMWVWDDLDDPHYNRSLVLRMVATVVAVPLFGLATGRSFSWWPFVNLVAASIGGALVLGTHDRARRRARHGLLPGGSDPRQVWVERTARPRLPDVPVTPLLVGLGLPLLAGTAACWWAAAHQHAVHLDFRLQPAAPADLAARTRPHLVIGVLLGAVVALVGMAVARRAGRRPSGAAVQAADTTRLVAALGGWALGVGLLALAGALVARWALWPYAQAAAVLGPVGLGVLVVGLRLAVAGRRRRAPVGLWDLAPRLGPRAVVEPVARALAWPDPGRPSG